MTQQYTAVTWQDETTSQQGTLINAERLNQMQTAHHFADGFEEVDAVPTADPGVSYHKVVYCTADSTFYRWDGTEWTKDIDDETKALLQQEIARATAAEGELAQDLADETTARETADTALGTRITDETSARQTADTALGNRITAEATARAEADTELGADIGAETARARQAEQANAQAIANTYTKAETDTLLAGKADTSTVQTLDTRVGALETGLADTYNKSQTDTLVATKLDKITSGSTLKAYTHVGANQGEISVSRGTDADSIGWRDANGRMYAADPASGATDRSLVTANWVSQTGDNAPNNLIHKTGNENRPNGVLTTQYMGLELPVPIRASTTNVWIRWIQFNSAYSENHVVEMLGRNANNGTFYAMFAVAGGGSFSRYAKIIEAGPNIAGFKVAILRNTETNAHEIWIYAAQVQTDYILGGMKYGNPARIVEINEEYASLPSSGYTAPFYVVGSE